MGHALYRKLLNYQRVSSSSANQIKRFHGNFGCGIWPLMVSNGSSLRSFFFVWRLGLAYFLGDTHRNGAQIHASLYI